MALYSIIPTLHASQRIEKERILFKAESSVGSEAEIIGYGVKPKIKRNSDTITNQPPPAHFYTSLLRAATSFRIVALQRGGVDWITTIAGGIEIVRLLLLRTRHTGPMTLISCQNRGQQQRGGGVVGWALKN
jgi:hypothetical protein